MMVEVGGRPVFVHTGGGPAEVEGSRVVLVHGAGMDHTVWRYQTRALAHSGRVAYAVDLPGHGRSEGEPLPDIEALGRWLIGLLDALEVERAVLIGHSMGSFAVLESSIAAPDRIKGLILLGTGDAMPVHPALMAAASAGDHLAVELIVAWSHTGSGRFGSNADPGSWQQGTGARILERGLGRSLAVDLQACHGYDAGAVAASVAVPTWIITASDDRMTPPAAARRLLEAIPGAVDSTVPAGHFALLDCPRLVQVEIVKGLEHFESAARAAVRG